MYVDLNPIRAALAETLKDSVHTSAFDWILGLEGQKVTSAAANPVVIQTEEAGRIRRTSTPDQLREHKARLDRRGKVLRIRSCSNLKFSSTVSAWN